MYVLGKVKTNPYFRKKRTNLFFGTECAIIKVIAFWNFTKFSYRFDLSRAKRSLLLMIHGRLSTILKTSRSNVFRYVKVCIFWEFIQYTIHWDKTQILKKFPSDRINSTKTALFFLSRAPNHHNFTFNSQFLYKLKHMVHHFKTVRVIFHFRFRLLFIKFYIFVQQKAWTLWLPKVVIPFKIKIIEKPHTVLVPDHWFLSCNKNIQWYLHEFGKFNDICVSWSSPKTDL